MNIKYREALSEVNYIIGELEEEEREKIPTNFKEFIRKNSLNYYTTTIDLNKKISEQNLHQETIAILSIIYRKFLALPDEREILERKYTEKLEREIQQISKKSQLADIKYFNEQSIKQERLKDVIEYKKEKWYKSILNKVKYIFFKN